MFNDDGLGQAMALHYAEQAGKDAQKQAASLQARVDELEHKIDRLFTLVIALSKANGEDKPS